MAHEITYIGSSVVGLKSLISSPRFVVREALCLVKRITPELISLCTKNQLELREFGWIEDFRNLVHEHESGSSFIIYQLDMLVPADLVSQFNFFNLHRGSLYNNRGPNPDIWPVLLGERRTCISLHRINDKIDAGLLIKEYWVEILECDNTRIVKLKLEKGIPVLIEALSDFLEDRVEGIQVENGVYRPWVTEDDFTIDQEKDTVDTVKNKIRCQAEYNGAIIYHENKKTFVNSFFEDEKKEAIVYSFGNKKLWLSINPKPKYPPPPIFPKTKRV